MENLFIYIYLTDTNDKKSAQIIAWDGQSIYIHSLCRNMVTKVYTLYTLV